MELAAKDRQCVAAEAEMGIMDLGLVLLVEVDVYGKALLSEAYNKLQKVAGKVLLLCYRDQGQDQYSGDMIRFIIYI